MLVEDSTTIELSDSYIHSEYRPTNQSFDPTDRRWSHGIDRGDSVFVTNSNSVLVAGCVIAFGESNLENHASTNVTVEGNFFLNPLGPAPRGNQVQTWGDPEHCSPESGGSEANCNSRDTIVRDNVALTCHAPQCDPSSYPYSPGHWAGSRLVHSPNGCCPQFEEPQTWDSFSFGVTANAIAERNYIQGGNGGSGCGLIMEIDPWNVSFINNTLDHTGTCGIAVAGAASPARVLHNIVYNNHTWADGTGCSACMGFTALHNATTHAAAVASCSTPCPGGSNTAIYVCRMSGPKTLAPVELGWNTGYAYTGYPHSSCVKSGLVDPSGNVTLYCGGANSLDAAPQATCGLIGPEWSARGNTSKLFHNNTWNDRVAPKLLGLNTSGPHPLPPVPPGPVRCVAPSPFSTQTGKPACKTTDESVPAMHSGTRPSLPVVRSGRIAGRATSTSRRECSSCGRDSKELAAIELY